jgi:hypothetical protein
MALFGGQRDISLFRTLNRELINDLVDTEVDIFKTSVYDVNDNLYGEAINKIYKKGVRVNCLITHDDQTWDSSEFGPDINQSSTFAFLRDDLLPSGAIGTPAANVILEVGDVIWWNNIYWEIDATNENQLIVGKTPDTDLGFTSGQRDDFGNSFSIICQTHQTRKSKVQFENIREGYSYGLYNE